VFGRRHVEEQVDFRQRKSPPILELALPCHCGFDVSAQSGIDTHVTEAARATRQTARLTCVRE
jgi:hypothetical protein